MIHFMKVVFAIVWKDILIEVRTKDIVISVLIFALLVLAIFNFAINPTSQTIAFVAPGILWVAVTFGGILGMNRAFFNEKENGAIYGLMSSPVSKECIFFGKMGSSLLFMLLIEAVVFPVFAVFYNFSLLVPVLIPVIVLVTVGLTCVGTLFSSMMINVRSREIMLPVLFFPMVVPLIIAGVEVTTLSVQEGSVYSKWIPFLLVFDAVVLVLAPLAFTYVLEE